MEKSIEEILAGPITTIPLAGKIVGGLSRSSSYLAASKGEIPTLTFGRKKVVPVSWIRRVLGLEAALRQGTSEHEGSDEDAV